LTNPIPEYIDKQRLLELLDEEIHVYSLEDGLNPEFDNGVLYLANKLKAVINLHTLDDHSAQEEIAKLKTTIALKSESAAMAAFMKAKKRADESEARALQAKQERDEAIGKLYDAEQTIEHWEMTLLRWREEERNALLEGLKWYAEEAEEATRKFHFGMYPSNIGDRARSIIAKIDGPKRCHLCPEEGPECYCYDDKPEGSKPDKGLYREGNGESQWIRE
jgi:hypothetical protein